MNGWRVSLLLPSRTPPTSPSAYEYLGELMCEQSEGLQGGRERGRETRTKAERVRMAKDEKGRGDGEGGGDVVGEGGSAHARCERWRWLLAAY